MDRIVKKSGAKLPFLQHNVRLSLPGQECITSKNSRRAFVGNGTIVNPFDRSLELLKAE